MKTQEKSEIQKLSGAIEVAPATILDLSEMASRVGATRFQWGLIRETAASGQCWAIRARGELVAAAGIVPIGPGQGEAWFHLPPQAAPHMLRILSAIRLTLRATPYRAVVTFCVTEAGRRIARAAGFRFARDSEHGEVWAYGAVRREQEQGADAAAAAAEPGRAGSPAGRD